MKKCLFIASPETHENAGANELLDDTSRDLFNLLSQEKSWEVTPIFFDTNAVVNEALEHSCQRHEMYEDSILKECSNFPRVSSLDIYSELLVKHEPDLVFMQLSDGKKFFNGLPPEHIVKNTSDKGIQLICFSGSSEQACEALSMGALDFIRLPCSLKRLERSLQKAKVYQSGLSSLQQHAERIIVKSVGNMEMIDVSDILWVKGAANYAELHCKDRVVLHRETLASLESKLSLSSFARVHRSALVNWTKVKAITSELGRYSILKMINDDEVKLSVSYKEHLFARLGV